MKILTLMISDRFYLGVSVTDFTFRKLSTPSKLGILQCAIRSTSIDAGELPDGYCESITARQLGRIMLTLFYSWKTSFSPFWIS